MKDESEKIDIPEELQQICRDFGEVAKKHKLNRFSGNFTPGYLHPWNASISFRWESGRHEVETNEIHINSEFHVHTKISSD